MHEWALAEAVITTALNVAKKENLKKITSVTVQLGELQQINEEIFRYALDEIVELHKKHFSKVTIDITIEKTSLQCNHCGHAWLFESVKNFLEDDEAEAIHFIPEVAFVHTRCPHCSSPDFRIIQGRGVSLVSIQGVKE
ncbi:MAG: hydrogenase nickel incorporation protein HypA [Thermoplasmatota archaeon]